MRIAVLTGLQLLVALEAWQDELDLRDDRERAARELTLRPQSIEPPVYLKRGDERPRTVIPPRYVARPPHLARGRR